MSLLFRSLITAVLICFTAIAGAAKDSPPVFYLGIEQGLSNNEVNCIFKSSNGYMWFGTFDGLNRYDGYTFKIFRKEIDNPRSLMNNRVQGMEEDQYHRLWVATMGGVSIYDGVYDHFSPLFFTSYAKRTKQRADNVSSIKRDGKNMLVGTIKDGLLYHSSENKQTIQIPLPHSLGRKVNYQVNAIEVDQHQKVWLLIEGIGLCAFDRNTRSISVVSDLFKNATSIKADLTGHIWLGTSTGVHQYTINKGIAVFKPLPHSVTSLYLDQADGLFITTDGGGIFVLNLVTGQITHLAGANGKELFASASIKGMLKDKAERIWVATLRGGINIIDEQRYRFKTLTPDPLEKDRHHNYFVSSFAEDTAHNLWIGTDGNGINYWNRQTDSYTHYRKENGSGLRSDLVTTVLYDQNQSLWVATWGGGIHRFNPSRKSFEVVRCSDPLGKTEFKNVWKLYQDKDQQIWASTFGQGGLCRFNPSTHRFEVFDGTIGNILCFSEDSKGDLWAGTDNRLVRIDKRTRKHLAFNIGYRVRSILEHQKDALWVATEGGGLLLFNTLTGKFKRLTEKDGLPNNAVLNILRDNQGALWLSTFNGISKFNPANQTFHNFFASDGLQSNQFSYLAAAQLQSGEMVFGGIRGFNLFFPQKIGFVKHKQQILLSDIKIDNVPVSDSINADYIKKRAAEAIEALVLPYDKASLSFEFTALEYSKPDKINYTYFLEGWDKNWIEAGKVRTANYGRLKEGNYVLHLKASNSEGEWGEEKTISIKVLPPWYRSWWAYSLYTAIMCGAIYLYVRYKRQQTELGYKVRLAQIETQQEKELNERKLSFFTNITHELRTPLTLIVNPVKELMDQTEHTLKKELNVVYRNASRLLTLVDQLMHFRTADQETSNMQIRELNLYQLCHDVYESYCKVAISKNIRYQLEFENKELMVFGDYEKLEIIFFNLISNAFKFTPSNGHILFKVQENEQDVELFVTDSGCGIHEDIKGKLFEKYYQEKDPSKPRETGFGIGLYLAKLYIDCHQGELHYASSPNKGTTFQIKLKKGVWFEPQPQGILQPVQSVSRPEQLPEEEAIDLPPVDLLKITDKRSLLLVDDNVELRQYLKKIFAERFVVYECGDGRTGFELVQKYIPDIVISDVLMEEGNGVDFCKKIKTHPTLNYIPVILLSGLSSTESKLKGIESGADDYMTKPFDKELLLARVNVILDNRDTLHQYFRDNITLRHNNQKISAAYKDFLEKCIAIVEENLNNEDFNGQWLAQSCNLSYSLLYKKVKSISGLSLNAFIRSIRLRKAALLMLSTNTNVNEAAFQVGIHDIKFFRAQFKKLYDMNPSEYIKKYRHAFNKEFNFIKHEVKI